MAISNSGSVGRGRPFSRLAGDRGRDSLPGYGYAAWENAVSECRRRSERMHHEPSQVSGVAADGAPLPRPAAVG